MNRFAAIRDTIGSRAWVRSGSNATETSSASRSRGPRAKRVRRGADRGARPRRSSTSAPPARSSSRATAELLRRRGRRVDARLRRPRPRGQRRRRERPAADVRGDRRLSAPPSSRRCTAMRSAAASGSSPAATSCSRTSETVFAFSEVKLGIVPAGHLAVRAPQDRRERRAALLRDRRAVRRRDGAPHRARARGRPTTSTARSTASLGELAHGRADAPRGTRSASCSSARTAPRPRAGSPSGGRATRARRASARSSSAAAPSWAPDAWTGARDR